MTDKIHRTEIIQTYSVESLMLPTIDFEVTSISMLPTLCCSFFPKCYNAWTGHTCVTAMSVAKKNKNAL